MNKEFFKIPRLNMANKVLQWYPLDTEERYKKSRKKRSICYGPKDIEYKFNNKGFRCDDFDDWTKHPYRILFAGCSMTEGIGLPLEDTWAKIMHEKICHEFNIKMPFWNIAVGGSGLDEMSRFLYHYIETLRPQIIISNLPQLSRREFWDDRSPFFWPSTNEEKDNTVRLVWDDKYIRYQTEKNLAIMSLLLEKYDSCLYFVTNDYTCNVDYIKTDIPKIIQLDMFQIEIEWDLARDGIHAGPKVNKCFANKFFEILSQTIRERLKC